ncbi:MAG: hypothetical protein KDJ14_04660 [Xanthomonadales bacterium]|nr:hypothetical protein [Xanthomonadales bacterium]
MDWFPDAPGQVLTNLIQNALIHAYPDDRGGVMRLEVGVLAKEHIELAFADGGQGVSPDQLPLIFDPFYITKPSMGGTDLGLHGTWNRVVEKLGGRMRADSMPCLGLSVLIDLPRVAPASGS